MEGDSLVTSLIFLSSDATMGRRVSPVVAAATGDHPARVGVLPGVEICLDPGRWNSDRKVQKREVLNIKIGFRVVLTGHCRRMAISGQSVRLG